MITKLKPKPKTRHKSIAKLREACAVLLQRLVRMKHADLDGVAQCVTCGKRDHWTGLQGGHYLERGRHATCLVEENIHPQCPRCNQFEMKKTSVMLIYRAYMVDMYGEDFVADLERQSRLPAKFSRGYLEDMKADLQKQIIIQEQRLANG